MKRTYTYLLGLFVSGVLLTSFSQSLEIKELLPTKEQIKKQYTFLSSEKSQQTKKQKTSLQRAKVFSSATTTNMQEVELLVPKNIAIEKQNRNVIITWEAGGNETQWQLVIQEKNSGMPSAQSSNIINVSTPSYTFTQAQNKMYEVYVCAIGQNAQKSAWSSPVPFSGFVPEGCAKLTLDDIQLGTNQSGDYVICHGENNTVHLKAEFDTSHFKKTTSYAVEQIPYNPPYPFLGGNVMNIESDDDYTASFNLPFDFCFFGNKYSFCRIGDNGVVAFGLPYTTTVGEYCPWQIENPIPNASTSIKNAIYGIFQDMHTTNSPGPNSQVNYQVIGEYPCRALVVNFNEVPAFGGGCTDPQYRTTTQIVLYEITNTIEVYVKKRKACNAWQGGKGVLGIQNSTGTIAYTPPGRNTGNWEATEEAWRFKPSGEAAVNFGWYANNVLISTENEVNYEVTQANTVIEARLSFEDCGQELVLSESFTVKKIPPIVLPELADVPLCVYENKFPEYNLETLKPQVLQGIQDQQNYKVEFYKTENDAKNGVNSIGNPTQYEVNPVPQTVYVKVTDEKNGCYGLQPVRFVKAPFATMPVPKDVDICASYKLPNLPDPLFSYDRIELINPISGAVLNVKENLEEGTVLPIGSYRVRIKMLTDLGCESFVNYKVEVKACDLPKGISPNGDGKNDSLNLADYWPQSVKIYNRYGKLVYEHGSGYTNQWVGQDMNGGELPSGTYFIEVQTMTLNFSSWIQLSR